MFLLKLEDLKLKWMESLYSCTVSVEHSDCRFVLKGRFQCVDFYLPSDCF